MTVDYQITDFEKYKCSIVSPHIPPPVPLPSIFFFLVCTFLPKRYKDGTINGEPVTSCKQLLEHGEVYPGGDFNDGKIPYVR